MLYKEYIKVEEDFNRFFLLPAINLIPNAGNPFTRMKASKIFLP